MKLAEALQIRADLQTRIAQMGTRLSNNATVQEGSEPAENPAELLNELDAMLRRQEDLVTRINLTNSRATNDKGETLTQLIARRDTLRQRVNMLRSLISDASHLTDRYRLSEIRVVSAINVAETQKKADELAKKLREDDLALQQLNWTVDLI
jgi:rRNA methylase